MCHGLSRGRSRSQSHLLSRPPRHVRKHSLSHTLSRLPSRPQSHALSRAKGRSLSRPLSHPLSRALSRPPRRVLGRFLSCPLNRLLGHSGHTNFLDNLRLGAKLIRHEFARRGQRGSTPLDNRAFRSDFGLDP